MTTIVPAVILGLAGSLHCVAMCGPLVALSQRGRSPWRLVPYHAGRLFVYAVLGLLAGSLGASLADAGFGRGVAIIAGLALLVQAFSASSWVARGPLGQTLGAFVSSGVGAAGRWLRRHDIQAPFALGALNGLLPCGLLYAALTASMGLGDRQAAAGFMIAFGLGTTPLLAFVGVAFDRLASGVPIRVRRAAPIVIAAVGLLLLWRGLGVGTPGDASAHMHHMH